MRCNQSINNVNQINEDGETPLFIASQSGQTEVVKLLLTAGADVNKVNHRRETPLAKAAYYGYHETVHLLLQTKDININMSDKWGKTPLFKAAWQSSIESLKLLLIHNVCMIEYKMKMI